jgi:NADPH:quinone reductase-like Zn-dependent oxidoreductase
VARPDESRPRGGRAVPFVGPQKLVVLDVKRSQADLLALAALIDAGKLRPVIDRSFPFEQTPEAIRYVEQGHARGKVLISFRGH